ncbi:ABC transporter permease [Uniformispora flossi]|uniref:ABC transporter permease n=1 Tax=Uniformispora flossi TaxID=3390723 RepID=UPI003C2D9CBD
MPFAAACPETDRPDRPPQPAARRGLAPAAEKARCFGALAAAGYRRYATYRQAAVAGLFTNIVFGAMLCAIMLAAAHGGNTPGGYTAAQLVAFVWIGQGLLNVVYMWGWREFSDRITSGDVTSDLLRPVDPIAAYAAADLGRAAQAMLWRWLPPVVFGLLVYDMYIPHRVATYPLFAASVILAVVVSFGGRYLVNLTAFWLLDVRGPLMVWGIASAVLSGNYFPLRFLPEWTQWLAWVATPFPSLFQAPLDVAVERTSVAAASATVLVQALWAVVLYALCVRVQRRGVVRLVVQGG